MKPKQTDWLDEILQGLYEYNHYENDLITPAKLAIVNGFIKEIRDYYWEVLARNRVLDAIIKKLEKNNGRYL